jgi:hypothetical protein
MSKGKTIPDRPTGLGLDREIRAYYARTGMNQRLFARAVGLSEQTISGVARSLFPKPRTVEMVRGFITAHPDGMAEDRIPARSAVAVQGQGGAMALAAAQAASVAPARPVPLPDPAPEPPVTFDAAPTLPSDLTLGEAVSGALVEKPSDLIALIKVKWPQLWSIVIQQSRAAGRMPGAVLIEAIERGLEAGA